MSINIEPLRKILELEQKKGYTDSAVIGGLDRYLRRWAGQAAESVATPQLLSRFRRLRLVDSDYASLTGQQRIDRVNELLDFVSEAERVGAEEGKIELPGENVVSSHRVAGRQSLVAKGQSVVPGQSIDSPITTIKGLAQVWLPGSTVWV